MSTGTICSAQGEQTVGWVQPPLCTFPRGMKKVTWSSWAIMSSVWYYGTSPAQVGEANPPVWARALEHPASLEEAIFIRSFEFK